MEGTAGEVHVGSWGLRGQNTRYCGFPGSSGVKNPPASAADVGPDSGRFHMS